MSCFFKIWNNCKVYNQHGSAIWFVADYMAKLFERLYHAWVQEFRDRYLRWAKPRARPWEHTCRKRDGKCGTPDDKMVLCDHCDAMYGIECMKMKKVPEGIWHCPECKPKLKTNKNIRTMSALSEAAARRKAELGDIPKKKVLQKMYLVKWAGLGYEFCTWETKDDINDDALIADYHKLNNMTPDEPDLTEEEVNEVLDKVEHIAPETAGGSMCIPDLRVQLYAQTRAFQFAKFGSDLPQLLAKECGPKTTAMRLVTPEKKVESAEPDEGAEPDEATSEAKAVVKAPKDVIETVSDIVHRVIRSDAQRLMNVNSSLPPLLTGEYDAIIPITSKGLMMNVGEIHGSVAFLGYRSFPDGSKGPAELSNIIRNVGDKIIAVDGTSTIDKSFKEVILMLRESGKNKYAFMRFLENRFAVCNSALTSVGRMGRYAVEELSAKFSTERKRALVQRKQALVDDEEEQEEEVDESDGSVRSQQSSDDSEDEGSEGEFQPDSDDEEMVENKQRAEQAALEEKQADGQMPFEQPKQTDVVMKEEVGSGEEPSEPANETSIHNETTRSLAFRLLDMEIGYSSDEGGDEDCACYVDGVDSTFHSKGELGLEDPPPPEETEQKTKGKGKKQKKEDAKPKKTVPLKKSEFSALGERTKITAAVMVTDVEPNQEEFENFPQLSNKQMEAKRKAEDDAKMNGSMTGAAGLNSHDDTVGVKRSTVKVEQLSTSTGEVIRIWANAETAAATLQISLEAIKRVLKGQYDEDFGDEIGGYRWRYARAGAEVTAIESTSKGSKKGKEAFLEFRDKLYDPADPHVYKNGNRLRDYQVDGVNWLASTWYKRHSCILADEMGLGKTVQIVTYIEHLFRVEKIKRPYLVVVPLSTVEHWRREFQGWTDMVCCVYHDRQRVWRDVLREYEWYFADRPHNSDYLKFDVLVTTYDTLIGDFDVVGQIPWRVAVVDEAHRLRNIKGKLLECMKEISAKGTLQYGFQSRILMTGTPLQNNTQELWTLLNFIEPYKFPSLEEFQMSFGNMANREQVEALQKKISPYMLRRVKEDVAKDIPSKEETVIDVELTSIQKQYYRAVYEHNHSFLNLGATRANAPKLMNIQMELRKCCNHPFLLEGVEQRETDRLYTEFVQKNMFQERTREEQQRLINEGGYIQTSGKMVLLDKLLPKLRQEGHKVLVFSQMVRMLDLISEYADFRGFRYERLDGRVRGNERQKAIDRFETEEDSFMFLLSTRAGGVGINLTAAGKSWSVSVMVHLRVMLTYVYSWKDTCIIFDSDWNPQNDVQAQARCHRIGQTKDVRIYRLITSRTFEQEMFDRASKKLGLEQAVLGTFNQENDDDKPSSKEMEALLKKGAYALLDEDNDDVTNQFCADDIDSILAKRTRTRVVEGAKTASWLNKAGMVVSKSKFSTDGSSGVDVDDPDFWQKVMPDFVTPDIMLTKLNELSDLIEGGGVKKGPGRGRGRKKKGANGATPPVEPQEQKEKDAPKEDKKERDGDKDKDDNGAKEKETEKEGDEDEGKEKTEGDDGEDADDEKDKFQLSRTNQRKVHKFMSDLKSMMDGILEEAEDDALPSPEKSSCQKLLLTISVKERIFNEEQRHLARVLLKRLEGDRRRRCRTSTEQSSRFSGRGAKEEDDPTRAIPDDALIMTKQQRRKRRRTKEQMLEDSSPKRKNRADDGDVDDDGYLQHSDSEGDWSGVGEDIYRGRKKQGISKKEARRRRAWAHDDDAATTAGRPWPAFPRNVVKKVLTTVLTEVMEQDKAKGGIFSEPVPRDQYPEYYDQIKHPMDYGTMKEKLERGEYRSAQAMQKDFILIMQNCVKFNAPDSDVVKEARHQALSRPDVLRNAALKHKLFLAEDGSVLEVYSDNEKEKKEDGGGKKKRGGRKKKGDDKDDSKPKKVRNATGVSLVNFRSLTLSIQGRRKGRKKAEKDPKDDATETENDDDDFDDDDEDTAIATLKKPRIRISMSGTNDGDEKESKPKKKGRKRKAKASEDDNQSVGDGEKADEEKTPGPKKKRKKSDEGGEATKKRRKKKAPAKPVEEPPPEGEADEKMEEEEPAEPKETSNENAEPEKDEVVEEEKIVYDENDPSSIYLQPDMMKQERETLKKGFDAARQNFIKRGAWLLPELVGEDRFTEVAKMTISKVSR